MVVGPEIYAFATHVNPEENGLGPIASVFFMETGYSESTSINVNISDGAVGHGLLAGRQAGCAAGVRGAHTVQADRNANRKATRRAK